MDPDSLDIEIQKKSGSGLDSMNLDPKKCKINSRLYRPTWAWWADSLLEGIPPPDQWCADQLSAAVDPVVQSSLNDSECGFLISRRNSSALVAAAPVRWIVPPKSERWRESWKSRCCLRNSWSCCWRNSWSCSCRCDVIRSTADRSAWAPLSREELLYQPVPCRLVLDKVML